MTRLELACYALIASACVLAGMLLVELGDRSVLPAAHAAGDGQVIHQDNITLMTTTTGQNDQALFLLDNVSGQLLVYVTDMGRKRIELMARGDLSQLLQLGAPRTGGPGTPAPRVPR